MVTKFYFWLVASDPETHRPYLVFGSDRDENDARQKGLEMLGGIDFEVRRLPTRDMGAASAMVRGKRLEQTHSLKKAKERLGHERTLRRRASKLQKSQAAKSVLW